MGCILTSLELDAVGNTPDPSNSDLRDDGVGIVAFDLQPNHSYRVR